MSARFDLRRELLVAGTKLGTLCIVLALLITTWSYCGTIFYDREAALHSALQCANDVLQESAHSFWLVNGSLLGASRLRRFVVWDAEIDVGFERKSAERTNAVVDRLHEKCFHFSNDAECDDSGVCLWTLCGRRVCLELHEFVAVDGQENHQQQLCNQDGCVLRSDVFPTRECNMAHTVTQCPSEPHKLLHESYGARWATEPLTSLF